MVKPLQQLKTPQIKPARLQPIKLGQISLAALRAPFQRLSTSDPKAVLSPRYLAVASGFVFTSVLAAQLVPVPFAPLQRLGQPATFQDTLWQATGVVRQSIVGLYRAQRVLLPMPAASPPAAAQPPSAGAPSQASKAPTPAAPKAQAAPANLQAPAPQRAVVNPGSTIDTNLEMRVAIARNVSSLEVGVSSDGFLMDLNGQDYCNLPAQTSYTARATGQGMDFGNCQLGTAAWLEAAEGGYVYIDGSWYKGRVLLLNEGGNLLAVNFVLLQDYLSSVVGSEMYVNWPIEALKAQAVAARSYALTHHVRPASRNYDLDNTQRYQAYLGIAKETNTTQIAVAETSGEFISYNGGIVESLYAASDQIVQEAHGGQGMSQNGAMQLASQGYDYSQILANYYPGTGLSRLVIE